MLTQKEQVINAFRAYIIALTKKSPVSGLQRFCVYLDAGEGLDVLWPSVANRKTRQVETLLRYQVRTERKSLPRYHFALKGCGYSKTDEIRQMLRAINPRIEVLVTGDGYSPGTR